jgi:hypothetical protein
MKKRPWWLMWAMHGCPVLDADRRLVLGGRGYSPRAAGLAGQVADYLETRAPGRYQAVALRSETVLIVDTHTGEIVREVK